MIADYRPAFHAGCAKVPSAPTTPAIADGIDCAACGMALPVILTPGPADIGITYSGSDGQRHYAHVEYAYPGGLVQLDRGYYGSTTTTLPRDARAYRNPSRRVLAAAAPDFAARLAALED